ncbi:hypothetical protein QQX98_000991 [Neonectria punicea]|uniref:AAA+ ATPase domain-containing protein n=1 Tax=Neonectria punicea TaxID=979145 RepID=A0ABR1HQM9_9HYPO
MGPRHSSSESASIITASDDEHEDDASNTKEPVQVGMTAEIKNLYRQDYREPWQEWTPDDIGIDSKSTPASAKNALIVRREKQLGDTDEPVLALHSITVQSPLIKKQLGPVFEDYKGINTNLKKLEFKAPFHEFFYRWNEFLQAEPAESEDEDGDTNRSHYKLLFDTISGEIKPHIEQAWDLLKNDVITFDYLWALFEPGAEIYTKADGHDRLYILSGGTYKELPDRRKLYLLPCRYIDTDGEGFGYKTTSLMIWEFENLKPIVELDVVPSRLQPGIDKIVARLTDRGREFERLKGFHHKAYTGTYERIHPHSGAPRKQHPIPTRLSRAAATPGGSSGLHAMYAKHGTKTWCPFWDAKRRVSASSNQQLSEGHYRLCTHTVKGFCLKAKEWGYFDIDLVKDISWSTAAFDQLVLPHDYKRVIRAFVDAQMSGLDDFDDVIKGKGRGIIMLLSGEPGTGKTLTSESVAETMQKPLYGMSAGELGNAAGEVEDSLHRVLELSTRWGAVLLLDECDVFLERRSTSDLQRNKLVSIFLRLLEYYEGVMFLTTNRVTSFDPAFESRIHLTIHYPNLDFNSRLHIWQTFVKRSSEGSGISESELAELALEELNGRQIKNVVKTARLLAASERTSLSLGHVKTVFKIKRGEVERV